MPRTVTYDRFEAGLDLRKGASVSDANRLRVLTNAYVTNGRAIKKRPCLAHVATLEAGTVGLRGGGGRLNTFYGSVAVAHANPLFRSNRVAHPDTATEPELIHFYDTFLGYGYAAVQYENGTIKHHYIDAGGLTGWATGVTYTEGDTIRPSTTNGYRYQMTSGDQKGTFTVTIAAPAVFTNVAHGMSVGNPVRFTTTGALPTGLAVDTTYYVSATPTADTFRVSATLGGADVTTTGSQSGVHSLRRYTGITGGVEPVWPTTPGATVTENAGNNEITWTCYSTAITDTNCPHTKQVITQESKILSISVDGETVRYCATNLPRDWTTPSDAGFIPSGIQATGESEAKALGQFRKDLAILFSDSTQVWNIDPDPALITLTSNVENVGTNFSKSPAALAGDLFFLSENGIRSVSVITLTDNLEDNDVGSPIDNLIQSEILASDDPVSIYYPGLGQYWLVNGATVYAYSFSRTSKVAAWSKYTLPFVPSDVTVLNSKLYMRNGDDVYSMERDVYSDFGTPPQVTIEFPFLDQKSSGILKQYMGADMVGTGTFDVQYRFTVNNQSLITDPVTYTGDTRPETQTPMELCAVAIAPVITHRADEDFQLDMMQFYLEELGPN
jgi:hypothetical protein